MTLMRKSALGPGRAVACQSCGRLVAAHWIAIIEAILAFLGGYFLMNCASIPVGVLAVVGGVLAMAFLQVYCVPLVRSDG